MRNYNADRDKDEGGKALPLLYVEGIVCGVTAEEMLHAWNTFGGTSREAVDWAHYAACEWNRYLGVPLTEAEHTALFEEQHKKLKEMAKKPLSLFRRECFPSIEHELAEILSSR